ncbi:hypothetical protein BDV59DRAFT_86499 [Aspergillus ambiguus]|uniref:mitotic regulator LTE1 n=1 Tax=Aspergillus ambiguus TaxID=176160 RepID=UPI003CCD4201
MDPRSPPETLARNHIRTQTLDRDPNAIPPAAPEPQYVTSTLRRAHTVAQGKDMGEKSRSGEKTARERMVTSLLRVKSSQEALRKRSLKRFDVPPSTRDALVGAREPNHFTVGNVGQNGKIFLRPIRNLSLKGPRLPPSTSFADQLPGDHLHPVRPGGRLGNEPSRWSNSQLSELRPELIPEENCEDGGSVYAESMRSGYHGSHPRMLQRAHSFSTISEQRSASRAGHHGEYRILIDRPDDRPKSAGSSRPAFDVPIPSHHLGLPLFSAETGTFLHSSIYSRTSQSENFRASPLFRENWNSSPIPDSFIGNPDRPSFAQSVFPTTAAVELPQGSAVGGKPVLYDLKEPIQPAIFDALTSEMDNSAVVRYTFGTKEISAATPARIVAQISSESFMDYELVSDFFLTFRSYLSISNLLALLLARLEWAINRLQDDGRIIRIRTFAALRHWILNYFVDDFIPNYDIRVRFCDTINGMYSDVKAREEGGTSDLKILIDLKRCWFGKCSAYWNVQDQHIAYQNPDHAIVPGGDETIDARPGDEQHLARTGTGQETSVGNSERQQTGQHDRNHSSATAKSMPISAESDNSIQPTSCSLPPKSPKRLSMPFPNQKAPHLVPLMTSKLPTSQDLPSLSPAISKRHPFHSHAHKRSGSFSDSVRDDRAPLSLLKLDNQASAQEEINLGSLIRGELYPPAESYMTMMAPPSPPLPSAPNSPALDHRSNSDQLTKPTSSGSGVKKTIIGSIRRALNSRHAGTSTSPRNTTTADAPQMRGKTSALPSNIAFGSDSYRDRKAAATMKRPARFDVLCDKALQQYRHATADSADCSPIEGNLTPRVSAQQGFCRDTDDTGRPTHGQSRIRSQLTAGSESIVIVDDTGLRQPLGSGALGANPPATARAPFRSPSQRSTLAGDEYSLPIYYDEAGSRSPRRISQLLRPPGPWTSRRSISVERGPASWKRTSQSLRLRKYASFQSGISRQRLEAPDEANGAIADQSSQDSDKPAGPTLRRRPGGDLRQMRDGLGLESRPYSGSYVSGYRSSVPESTISRQRDLTSRPQTSLVPPNPRFSLIQTHSSQNLRRSFEAAIAQFAQIPDDDDGGIESTLLKLEGKWKGATCESEDPQASAQARGGAAREQEMFYRGSHLAESSSDPSSQRRQTLADNLTYSQVRGRIVPHRPYSASIAETEESYSSIPLLERGLSDESMKKPRMSWGNSYQDGTPQVHVREVSEQDTSEVGSSHPSIDVVRETESLKCIPRGSTVPVQGPRLRPSNNRASRLSGLSSELSVDFIDPQEALDQRLSIDTRSLSESSLGIPPHPLAHPPSPPMTIQNTRSIASCATPLNPELFQSQPLTPDPSPRHRELAQGDNAREIDVRNFSGDILSRSEIDRQQQNAKKSHGPDHVPFVLSCESQTLAQQLTVVEIAALSEVDWRDLVDMRWNNGSLSALSWVQFLMEEERRGIDLVVGRFNLMVKWVLSEIILTQDIHERARTVTKFIHTAAHARRICNYATMLQIAIALSSTDCSRLQKTWALVSPDDRRLLKDMELLIQPVRNFHDLRVEMETASVQEGCIPFVGLYVHDLTYNAQKPAQVAARNGEPLINFERYRTAAKIVKSLLRLIDASTKYRFEPVQGIIERCLWIASLSEDQIQSRSKLLD